MAKDSIHLNEEKRKRNTKVMDIDISNSLAY